MVTGKNKEQFEKWYINDLLKVNECAKNEGVLKEFYSLNLLFQIGVYLAYYDSLGNIDIETECRPLWNGAEEKEHQFLINRIYQKGVFKTRNEAYQEAFKQADKLINNKL